MQSQLRTVDVPIIVKYEIPEEIWNELQGKQLKITIPMMKYQNNNTIDITFENGSIDFEMPTDKHTKKIIVLANNPKLYYFNRIEFELKKIP